MLTLIQTGLTSIDLGPNNPSKQCDGANGCNYHYARGDAGWISAFEVYVVEIGLVPFYTVLTFRAQVANANGVPRIYFPRGQYWCVELRGVKYFLHDQLRNRIRRFGKTDISVPTYNSTVVDISLYPRLWDGTALEVFGAGDYATHFTTWGPTPDGPMLLLTSSKTIATMSWSVHGMHFDGCSVDYAFAVNKETPVSNPGPRAEHNNFKLFDVTFVRDVM